MIINKAFKFRIYPNEDQQVLIAKTIGCCRFIFNHFLDKWNHTYNVTGKGLSYGNCSAGLPTLKKELTWLQEVDSIALQSSVRNLADSFDRFFKKQNNLPRFKTKRNKVQSYTTKHTNNNIAVIGDFIKLPKLGLVKFAKSREIKGRILNATVSRKPSGKYFVSILVETEFFELPKTNSSVGIDVGLRDFAVLSDKVVYKNPQALRMLEDKLVKAQRVLSRRQEQAIRQKKPLHAAMNYQKQRKIVACIHEKIANIRNDYLHKVSTEIIKNHDVIGIEDLQVSKMLQNRNLAKAISDVSWSQFRTMLEYKARWYGKTVIAVAKNFPSSQLCSSCGFRHKDVKDLALREWKCPACNSCHDRDFNASINLENEVIRLLTAGTAGLA